MKKYVNTMNNEFINLGDAFKWVEEINNPKGFKSQLIVEGVLTKENIDNLIAAQVIKEVPKMDINLILNMYCKNNNVTKNFVKETISNAYKLYPKASRDLLIRIYATVMTVPVCKDQEYVYGINCATTKYDTIVKLTTKDIVNWKNVTLFNTKEAAKFCLIFVNQYMEEILNAK